MKNILNCPKCQAENPYYNFTCNSCNSYIRARIVNIDLWTVIGNLLHSPINTTRTLICSEHKNFISLILLIGSFKVILNVILWANLWGLDARGGLSFANTVLLSVITSAIIIIVSYAVTKVNSLFGLMNRFLDNLTIYSYSLIPIIIVLVIITPIQFALLGNYWFTFEPSPFLIKPMVSKVLISIEILFQLWTIILFITSTYAQTNNKIYSIITGISILFVIYIVSYNVLSIFS